MREGGRECLGGRMNKCMNIASKDVPGLYLVDCVRQKDAAA